MKLQELTPEWYYCPEMFQNVNNVTLGRRQSGEYVDAVELPPWANGPHDFVHKLRAALESDHVSENLHHWIDLIFGYKQQGQAAKEANNVFYYLTYEGLVDIDAITDPLILKATQDQIAFFGQTPSQLFKQQHPKRQPRDDAILPVHVSAPSDIQAYLLYASGSTSAAGAALRIVPEGLLVASHALDLTLHKLTFNRSDGRTRPFTYYGAKRPAQHQQSFIPNALAGRTSQSSLRILAPLAHTPSIANCIAVDPFGTSIFVAGADDGLLYAYSLSTMRCYEKSTSECLDSATVCIATCPSGRLLATATTSGAILLFSLPVPLDALQQSASFQQQSFGGRSVLASAVHSGSGVPAGGTQTGASAGVSDTSQHSEGSAAIAKPLPAGGVPLFHFLDGVEARRSVPLEKTNPLDAPIHALHGRSEPAESLAIDAELDIIASVSSNEGTLLHTILTGRMVRRIASARGNHVRLCSTGYVVVLNSRDNLVLCVSTNGDVVARLHPDDGSSVADVQPSADGQAVFVAHRNMHKGESALRVHKLPSLVEAERLELPGWAEIASLAVTSDNTNVVACTPEGKLYVLTDPSTSLKLLSRLLRVGFTV